MQFIRSSIRSVDCVIGAVFGSSKNESTEWASTCVFFFIFIQNDNRRTKKRLQTSLNTLDSILVYLHICHSISTKIWLMKCITYDRRAQVEEKYTQYIFCEYFTLFNLICDYHSVQICVLCILLISEHPLNHLSIPPSNSTLLVSLVYLTSLTLLIHSFIRLVLLVLWTRELLVTDARFLIFGKLE